MVGEINLILIFLDIFFDYFKNILIFKRVKERGYNYFMNSYVYVLKLYKFSDELIDIVVKCFWFMCKSEVFYKINMIIMIIILSISESYCLCKVGYVFILKDYDVYFKKKIIVIYFIYVFKNIFFRVSGICFYLIGMLYILIYYKNFGMIEVFLVFVCISML